MILPGILHVPLRLPAPAAPAQLVQPGPGDHQHRVAQQLVHVHVRRRAPPPRRAGCARPAPGLRSSLSTTNSAVPATPAPSAGPANSFVFGSGQRRAVPARSRPRPATFSLNARRNASRATFRFTLLRKLARMRPERHAAAPPHRRLPVARARPPVPFCRHGFLLLPATSPLGSVEAVPRPLRGQVRHDRRRAPPGALASAPAARRRRSTSPGAPAFTSYTLQLAHQAFPAFFNAFLTTTTHPSDPAPRPGPAAGSPRRDVPRPEILLRHAHVPHVARHALPLVHAGRQRILTDRTDPPLGVAAVRHRAARHAVPPSPRPGSRGPW